MHALGVAVPAVLFFMCGLLELPSPVKCAFSLGFTSKPLFLTLYNVLRLADSHGRAAVFLSFRV